MDVRKHILLVINSATDEELVLIKQAIDQAKHEKNMTLKISLVHVLASIPTCYFNIPSMVHLAEQDYKMAKNSIAEVAEKLGVSKEDQWIVTGRMKTEVLRLAHKLQADFILANSTHLQDLHKSVLFKRAHHYALKNISNLNKFASL